MRETPSRWMHVDSAVDLSRRVHPTTNGIGRAVGASTVIIAAGTPATYTVSTRRVALASAFTGYVRAQGDLWIPEAGTGFDTSRSFLIQTNTSANITLTASNENLPIADNTDSVGYIIPISSPFARPCVGASVDEIVVTTIDAAENIIQLRALESSALLMQFTLPTTAVAPFRIPLGNKRGAFFPRGFTANCGQNATTLAFDVYYRVVD